jgi:hypothetical protein
VSEPPAVAGALPEEGDEGGSPTVRQGAGEEMIIPPAIAGEFISKPVKRAIAFSPVR